MKLLRIMSFAILGMVSSGHTLLAQDQTVAPAGATVITIDLKKKSISPDIPFDKPFMLTGEVDSTVAKVTFKLIRGLDEKGPVEYEAPADVVNKRFVLPYIIDPCKHQNYLLPERKYVLKLIAQDAQGDTLHAWGLTYGFYPKTKLGDYTKLDFGLGYAFRPKAVIGYTSVHFFFTAINEEADMQDIRGWRNLFTRLNVYMGAAPLVLTSDTRQPIKNRFGIGNFIYGVGIRSPFYGYWPMTRNRIAQQLLQTMHVNVGQMIFSQAPASTLLTQDVHKTAFYIGFSYNLNIASILGPVTKLVAP